MAKKLCPLAALKTARRVAFECSSQAESFREWAQSADFEPGELDFVHPGTGESGWDVVRKKIRDLGASALGSKRILKALPYLRSRDVVMLGGAVAPTAHELAAILCGKTHNSCYLAVMRAFHATVCGDRSWRGAVGSRRFQAELARGGLDAVWCAGTWPTIREVVSRLPIIPLPQLHAMIEVEYREAVREQTTLGREDHEPQEHRDGPTHYATFRFQGSETEPLPWRQARLLSKLWNTQRNQPRRGVSGRDVAVEIYGAGAGYKERRKALEQLRDRTQKALNLANIPFLIDVNRSGFWHLTPSV
jgi:hypothetical protein